MSALLTPDLIWQPAVDIVRRRHVEHLAKLEAERGLPARTIERVKTVDVLAFEGARFKTDVLPCILIGVFGLNEAPTRRPSGQHELDWLMAMEVTVAGTDRADTTKRRDWYTMTAVECVLSRVPRHVDPIGALYLMDIDLSAGDDPYGRAHTLAQSQVLFGVKVADSVDLHAALPDDDPLNPGGAGGVAPDPYDVEPPWPVPVQSATETTTLTSAPAQEDPTP
jgi:hypothetical protein